MTPKKSSSPVPGGTVTFLFTDIEGSTRLLHQLGEDYVLVLDEHRKLMRKTFAAWRGQEVDTQGDSFFVAFGSAGDAIAAAVEIQKKIHDYVWPNGVEVRVRMGLHTGEPWVAKEGFVGVDVHRAARISSIGHGGQVLLSESTKQLILDYLPEGVSLVNLGEHRLKDIPRPEPINQLVIEGLPSEFPTLKSLDARPNNLPSQPTPFVGRHDELAELEALIANPEIRLVTIVGAGGMGKSRLALATAERQLFKSNGKDALLFPDGVFFVPLAPLVSEEQIFTAIAKAVKFQFYQGVDPSTQLLEYFREKRSLLVMDNFEHVLGGASILPEILQVADGVKVLATSREKLNLRTENIYVLHGMAYPEDEPTEDDLTHLQQQYSAVNLFKQSARQVNADLAWTQRDMRTITEICSMVEGMPLGIELAAAWVEMLSLEKIATEIRTSLDFLEGNMRDVPDRHQSIRALFEYTWNMLGEQERQVFSSISVFRGGFTLEAAEQVTGASMKEIRLLVSKSLIHLDQNKRYKIHELLRQYAAEKLEIDPGESNRIRDQHSEYFADFVHQREAAIRGGDQTEALEEMDNIQVGWRWAVIQRNAPVIRKQMQSLFWIHEFQGWFQEAADSFDWAVKELQTDEPLGDIGIAYGQVLNLSATFHDRIGDNNKAILNLEECISNLVKLDALPELAWAYIGFGHIDISSDHTKAKQRLNKGLAIYRELNIKWGIAITLNTLGNIAANSSEHEDAKAYYEEALRLNTDLNDPRGMSWSIGGLGRIAFRRGEYLQARKFFEKTIALRKAIGYKLVLALSLVILGQLDLLMGKYKEANLSFREVFAITHEMGWHYGIAEAIRHFGTLALAQGEYDSAKEKYEDALARFQNIDDRGSIGYVLSSLGNVAAAMGDIQDARENFHTALEIGVGTKHPSLILHILAGLSAMLDHIGNDERAVEMAALVASHTRSDPLPRERAKKLLDELGLKLPSRVFEAAQERGKASDLDETVKEFLEELAG
ncbi:MAG: tetratricopeptide repeat protein [Anaerolineales bacterium]|nr:tetratricopeptide repeat protein [Anaerolineales bacterium]